ncbi:MAG: hypothetical protein DHS20C19_21240 [Acidimicrobiales bacterium]|nr:MAG: hypothetical protein DHS20C19_21240 [Acidimicrobiales bacterium]
MTDARVPPFSTTMGRRSFLGRTAAAGVATWAVPTVLSTDPVAAATGSCSGVTVHEFTSGLEGWTIDNSWGSGVDGLWNHNTEASRDGGSLHYGRGTNGNFETGSSRNSGRVLSPEFEIPSTGTTEVRFTVWREVETQDDGYDRLRLRMVGPPNSTLYSVSSIGDTAGFELHTISLPGGARGRTVQFQFDFDTRDGLYNDHEGIYIGRFEVDACPPPGAGGSFAPLAASRFSASASSAPSDDAEADAAPPPRR